jgi:hypothetical protein
MAAKLKLIPGSTIRWGARRFVVVDYVGLDAVIAREVGKRKLERIPVRLANPDRTPGDRAAWTPDLVSIPEGAWEGAVKRFKSLKPLLEMDRTKRTLEKVQEVADAVGKHPATIYRWLEAYECSERVSVFLPRRVLQQTYSTCFSDFALEFYTFLADNYAPFQGFVKQLDSGKVTSGDVFGTRVGRSQDMEVRWKRHRSMYSHRLKRLRRGKLRWRVPVGSPFSGGLISITRLARFELSLLS